MISWSLIFTAIVALIGFAILALIWNAFFLWWQSDLERVLSLVAVCFIQCDGEFAADHLHAVS